MDSTTTPEVEDITQSNSPDSDVWARRRGTLSSIYTSTASSSSPGLTTDTVNTPDSDSDADKPSSAVTLKQEELEEQALADIDEVKPSSESPLDPPGPRKRGRPRKHPLVDQKKVSQGHSRSKTGCGTCRRRKKKCDESKPSCLNCEKNNVVCDGYEPKQLWRSGKQKSLTIRDGPPTELPLLVDGIDGKVDQLFFQHFTCHVARVLSLTDHQNPFLEIIVPMAMAHKGLMHSLLYLSGSCLLANETSSRFEWERRSEHHSSQAIGLLKEDLGNSTRHEADALAHVGDVGDPSIAQTLILCLQTVASGDLTGTYRIHLNAMKEMLTRKRQAMPNEPLRQFILEFLIYHDYSSSITSLANPIDQRSIDLFEGLKLPTFMIQPQAGALLGVLDGLFGFISRIRQLRDQIRHRRSLGTGHWWDEPIINEAFAIDNALRHWQCVYPPNSPRYAASLLYRQCTWIYLHRTIQLSRASPTFKQAVDEGLTYLRMLAWNNENDVSAQSILLMPLFLLGCAAFESEQRPEIQEAFARLQSWSSFGNIKYARCIIEEVWEMMDQGHEEETWDWETIIANRGWDFLIT